MANAFHDDDALDIAEQLLIQSEAINAQLRAIIAKHRETTPRVITHDGSAGVDALHDEPPSLRCCS